MPLPDNLDHVAKLYELKERQKSGKKKKNWFKMYKGQISLEGFTIQLHEF